MLLPFSLWGKGWGLGSVTLPEKSLRLTSWGLTSWGLASWDLYPGVCILGINPQVGPRLSPGCLHLEHE